MMDFATAGRGSELCQYFHLLLSIPINPRHQSKKIVKSPNCTFCSALVKRIWWKRSYSLFLQLTITETQDKRSLHELPKLTVQHMSTMVARLKDVWQHRSCGRRTELSGDYELGSLCDMVDLFGWVHKWRPHQLISQYRAVRIEPLDEDEGWIWP